MVPGTGLMEGIEITQGKVGARRDIAMLAVKGYVDTMTCSILLSKITENLKSGFFHIVVDMGQVNYVSSAGWGVFVGEIKGIREQGGDLKIVQLTPEVHDVFEMLEFNRILSHYETIEEAINDFDLSIGLDITKSVRRKYNPVVAPSDATEMVAPPPPASSRNNRAGAAKQFEKREIDPKLLPITEKVKHTIIEDPRRGVLKVRKVLRTPKYGNTQLGLLQAYRMLRRLNLDSKEKRYRFYRSR